MDFGLDLHLLQPSIETRKPDEDTSSRATRESTVRKKYGELLTEKNLPPPGVCFSTPAMLRPSTVSYRIGWCYGGGRGNMQVPSRPCDTGSASAKHPTTPKPPPGARPCPWPACTGRSADPRFAERYEHAGIRNRPLQPAPEAVTWFPLPTLAPPSSRAEPSPMIPLPPAVPARPAARVRAATNSGRPVAAAATSCSGVQTIIA
jgi:hypothetical protein